MKLSNTVIRFNHLFFAIILVLITFGIYYHVLFNDFVYFDDDKLIFNNQLVINPETPISECFKWGFKAPHYKPITLLTWRAEYQLFGRNPLVFHLDNLILHILNTLLVYLISILLLNKINIKKEKINLTAFIIALLFAVHPLHVESVAWATERKDVLFAFFFLLSWLSYLNYLKKNKYYFIILTAVFYLFSILSKSMGITLIAVLFITDFYWGRKDYKKIVLEKMPAIIILLVGAYCVGILSDSFDSYTNTIVGEENLNLINTNNDWQEQSGLAQRFLLLVTKLFLWIIHIVFPTRISVDYNGFDILKTVGSLIKVFPFIIAGLIITGVFYIKKHREILFGLIFFFVTISPALLTTDYTGVSTFLSDRYTYIPLFGIVFIFSILVLNLFRNIISFVIITIVLTTFSLITFKAVKVWQNTETIWMNVLQKSKCSVPAYNGLGHYYFHFESDTAKAIEAFSKAIDCINSRKMRGDGGASIIEFLVLKNRGLTYYTRKDYELALADLNEYLKLKPKDFSVIFTRALIYFNKNEFQLAMVDWNRAIQLSKDDAMLYLNRSITRFKLNEYEPALTDINKSIELNDTIAKAYYMRSQINYKLDNSELAMQDEERYIELGGKSKDINSLVHELSAIGEFDKVQEVIDKNESLSEEEKIFLLLITSGREAYNKNDYVNAGEYFEQCNTGFEKFGGYLKYPDFLNSWAHCLLEAGEILKAKSKFIRSVEENSKDYFALKNLGFIAFQHEKDYAAAIVYYERSLKANNPAYFQSYENLGAIYLIQNLPEKAIESYENALKYGNSKEIFGNLSLLWKSKGNEEKSNFYKELWGNN